MTVGRDMDTRPRPSHRRRVEDAGVTERVSWVQTVFGHR